MGWLHFPGPCYITVKQQSFQTVYKKAFAQASKRLSLDFTSKAMSDYALTKHLASQPSRSLTLAALLSSNSRLTLCYFLLGRYNSLTTQFQINLVKVKK